MMVPVVVVGFSFVAFAEGFLTALATVAAWKRYQEDPVADLVMRLQHPIKWTCLHPLQAMGRTIHRVR